MGPSPALPSGVILQERDIALLRGLFECRVMTLEHVSALYFEGKADAAKKRVQKLKAAGLITERPRRQFQPSILTLTRVGLELLQTRGILAEYPAFSLPALERRAKVSERTLAHELEVVDLKAAFCAAARNQAAVSVAEFSTWPLLNEFTTFGARGERVLVQPDGFLRIHESEIGGDTAEHSYFIEVDRSSESLGLLERRAISYRAYYSSGGFAERNGAPRSMYRDYPFRVLMVFKTAERRNNTAERLLACNPPILTHVWLTTIDEIRGAPLAAIWIRPLDYRNALAGSPIESTTAENFSYRRNRTRDIVVEKTVTKSRLLT